MFIVKQQQEIVCVDSWEKNNSMEQLFERIMEKYEKLTEESVVVTESCVDLEEMSREIFLEITAIVKT